MHDRLTHEPVENNLGALRSVRILLIVYLQLVAIPSLLQPDCFIKGELQREKKLISYERMLKMLENDTYITGIGQAVLKLLSFKIWSGNDQRGISLLQKSSEIFGNMRLVSLKMTSNLTSDNFQILIIDIFS